MPTWIDFKELRSKLRFEEVLAHYGVEVKRRGEQHTGFCPLPGHSGKRNTPSFSANLERGIFQCFGCQAKGNILDFAVLMEKEDPKDGRGVKKVAAGLRAKFCPDDAKENGRKPARAKDDDPPAKQLEMDGIVNEPLDFELKGLDPDHPYLAERGFSHDTTVHFGLGYCARGLLAERIAIPLHDSEGRLIGYAGRVIDDKAITADNPKYRLPSKREREGRTLEFRKSLFLYNGFRVTPGDNLIVVEGFPSVWWLHQHGFSKVVATMGSDVSDEQIKLILGLVYPTGNIRIMPDSDKAGERFAQSLLTKLSPERFVRWVKLADGCQPTDLSEEQLNHCLVF